MPPQKEGQQVMLKKKKKKMQKAESKGSSDHTDIDAHAPAKSKSKAMAKAKAKSSSLLASPSVARTTTPKGKKKTAKRQAENIVPSKKKSLENVKVSCKVFILRHAERCENMEQSEFWKETGRVYDPTITPKGTIQAVTAAEFLQPIAKENDFSCIFTSPLVRCVETACIVAKHLNIPVKIVNGLGGCTRALRNSDINEIELGSVSELKKHCKCKKNGVHLSKVNITESLPFEALLDIVTSELGRNVLVCSHRETVRELLADEDDEPSTKVSRKQIGFCSISQFGFDEDDCVFRFVDINHPTIPDEEAKKKKQKDKKRRQKAKRREKILLKKEKHENWLKKNAKKDEKEEVEGEEGNGKEDNHPSGKKLTLEKVEKRQNKAQPNIQQTMDNKEEEYDDDVDDDGNNNNNGDGYNYVDDALYEKGTDKGQETNQSSSSPSTATTAKEMPIINPDFEYFEALMRTSIRPKSLTLSAVAHHSSTDKLVHHGIDVKLVKEGDGRCSICLGGLFESEEDEDDEDPMGVVALPCSHLFHDDCIVRCLKESSLSCPECTQRFGGTPIGDMPDGQMSVQTQSGALPGYLDCGSIIISYSLPSGTHAGQRYQGTSRTAYLPNNKKGRKVLKLLQKAFENRHTFCVGYSVTLGPGAGLRVVWAGIHHKTSFSGQFGYPDPTYLDRVIDEIKGFGIVLDEKGN
eukprot:m.114590 g.114590  ORF g.114590 m.114590 type:complete len:692 (+) comp9280_c2_seq3:104-2179(+)